jgi:hypothetical protein
MMRSRLRVTSLILAGLCWLSAAGCYVEAGPPPPPPGQEVVVESPPPPPPPQPETQPASPGVEFEWVAGYHRWDGHRYIWERGRYEHRPHANARYAPAHWEPRGRGHVWIEGRWQ